MNPDLWEQVNRVLDELGSLKGAEQELKLRESCAGDEVVEREVRNLLGDLDECPPDFLGIPGEATDGGVGEGKTLGDFHLIKRLGQGGGGAVYEAHQISLDRRVALKVRPIAQPGLEPHLREPERRRMRREAVVAGRLRHPGIATIHGFGRESAYDWIAMELVPGRDLDAEIARQAGGKRQDGKANYLPGVDEDEFVATRLMLVRDVALALHAAHEAGVIHRDVKPANIMVQPTRIPKLVDFGLARGPSSLKVTAPDIIAGSVYFMSPEQARGTLLDRRTDVYSLGCVLFQLLTSKLPFQGTVMPRVLEQIKHGPTPGLRGVDASLSEDLEAVCAKAMAGDVALRYETTLEFAEDLARVLSGEPVRARRLTPWYRTQCWVRSHQKALVISLVGSAAACALALALIQTSVDSARSEAYRVRFDSMAARLEAHIEKGSMQELAALSSELERLEREPKLGAIYELAAAGMRAEIESYGQERLQEANHKVAGIAHAGGYAPLDNLALSGALDERQRLVRLLPLAQREQISNASEFPLINIGQGQAGDMVWIYPATPLSSGYALEPSFRLETPVVDYPLAPGRYRIVLERPGVGFAEWSRWLGQRGRTYDLGQANIVPNEDVILDMASYPAGEQELVLPLVVDGKPVFQIFAHDAFYLDRFEVSNGEFLAFLNANPHLNEDGKLEPGLWKLGSSEDEEWLTRPVGGISWQGARSYAEWVGKRLPTEMEWMRALSGIEGRTYPWGEDESFLDQVSDPAGFQYVNFRDSARVFEQYMAFTRPVRAITLDSTGAPENVLNLAGNVGEWTDSMALNQINGPLIALPSYRRIKGWNWKFRDPRDLVFFAQDPLNTTFELPRYGFRCAKSAAPH